ncbi:MAG: response regulator [Proteobacteria bacterium]|nr:response regulator [Pseudomonadota bacterium]
MAKILVIDDSDAAIRVVRRALEEAGHQVVSSGSPFAFSQIMTAEKPDLALVDVNLPAITGDKLIQIARTCDASHSCPLVLYSARAPEQAERLVRSCGASGFIDKAADPATLVSRVQGFLQSAS